MTAPRRRSLRNTVARALLRVDVPYDKFELRVALLDAGVATEAVAEWLDNNGVSVAGRAGCECEPYRKPCQYHEGTLDGVDLAAMAIVRGWAS